MVPIVQHIGNSTPASDIQSTARRTRNRGYESGFPYILPHPYCVSSSGATHPAQRLWSQADSTMLPRTRVLKSSCDVLGNTCGMFRLVVSAWGCLSSVARCRYVARRCAIRVRFNCCNERHPVGMQFMRNTAGLDISGVHYDVRSSWDSCTV